MLAARLSELHWVFDPNRYSFSIHCAWHVYTFHGTLLGGLIQRKTAGRPSNLNPDNTAGFIYERVYEYYTHHTRHPCLLWVCYSRAAD